MGKYYPVVFTASLVGAVGFALLLLVARLLAAASGEAQVRSGEVLSF